VIVKGYRGACKVHASLINDLELPHSMALRDLLGKGGYWYAYNTQGLLSWLALCGWFIGWYVAVVRLWFGKGEHS
jgi:hypothetical protein